MERRRVPRRRGLSSAEIQTELSATASIQQSKVTARLLPINGNSEITGCKDRPYICGKEAACRSFKDSTSKCVCPHDLSSPTTDLKCPNRLTVPLTPRPIPNIIPPNGNSTNSTTALPEAEQVERARQRVPEIIGIAIAFIAVLAIFLSIVYCVRKRSYNVKSQRNSLDVRQTNHTVLPLQN